MTYQPHHNAIPGSTAYYTLPNIGGFYAPVSRNEPVRRHVDDSDHDDDEDRSRNKHTLRPAMPMPPQPVYGQPHPPFVQQPQMPQQPQMHPFVPPPTLHPQAWNYPGAAMPTHAVVTGQTQDHVFNGWKGVPEKDTKEKDTKEKDTKKKGKTDKADQADREKKDAKEKKERKSKTSSSEAAVSPWQQLSDRLRKRSEKRRRHSHVDEDSESYSDADCVYDYDVCDTPVRHGRNSSPQDQVTFSESADVKVIIQPYGSARVIVHIEDENEDDGADYKHDHKNGNERMVAFVVSDRCLSVAGKEWPHQCHPGTRTCNIRVGCDEAVIGMYWMLHVLHHAGRDSTVQNSLIGQQRDRQFQQQVALQRYLQQRAVAQPRGEDDENEENNGITDHFVYDYYHGSVGTRAVPIELPPRVLAFALMYAVQFGVLEPWQPGQPLQISRLQASLQASLGGQTPNQTRSDSQAKGTGQDQDHSQRPTTVSDPAAAAAVSSTTSAPTREAFRIAANQWLQSIAGTRVNMTIGRLNSVTVPPVDLLFVLYAGRVLGSPTVLRLCQLTILDRWSIDDTVNWFRDGCGCPVRAGEILAPQMAETVSMDLFSLKTARDRSLTKVADLATRLHGSQLRVAQ